MHYWIENSIGFIFFILSEKIFDSKLLKYSYYGEPGQNLLFSERKRAQDKSLNDWTWFCWKENYLKNLILPHMKILICSVNVSVIHCCLLLSFLKILFIHLRYKDTKREHKQREGQREMEEGAWCRTWSQDPGIMTWAKGRGSTTEPPRHPKEKPFEHRHYLIWLPSFIKVIEFPLFPVCFDTSPVSSISCCLYFSQRLRCLSVGAIVWYELLHYYRDRNSHK